MNNILYISGDGIAEPKNKWKNYFNYFDGYSKNYFITKALKSLINKCEILNFSHSLRHPILIFKLESLSIPGSTFLRIKTIILINYCIHKIIYWKIKSNSYDLIIFSDNLFFINKKLIKAYNKLTLSKIILLSGVSPNFFLSKPQKECIPYFDMIFISDLGHKTEWKDLGAQHVICLPISAGCPKTFQKVAKNYNKRRKYDIVFIGRLDTGSNEYRIKTLNFLLTKGVNIKIWTWFLSNEYIKKYPLLNTHVVGSAYGKEMVKIISQSKIVLNIHGSSVPYGGNMRLFEIPAAKSLQIADKCPQDWFKDGDEIVLYKNNQDLLQKINYFINNDSERERIAKNGYEKLVRKHQYKHRVKKIFESISITS
jgi:hypothetical protein